MFALSMVLRFKNTAMHYHQWGNGPVALLCFHGIGQDGRAFAPFGNALDSRFTIYSFDLFYHGQTACLHGDAYAQNERLTPDNWTAILTAFLDEKNICRFSVAGFSMGGVFALATVQAFAGRVDELWLLAPDGITTNAWYRFATGSGFGRAVFRFFLDRLPLLRHVSNGLVKAGLLDRSLVRFAQSTLATPDQRERVYRSWVAFRPLRLPLQTLAHTLNAHPIRIRVFLGTFDRVLPPEAVQPLFLVLPTAQEVLLPVGHNRLIEVVSQLP